MNNFYNHLMNKNNKKAIIIMAFLLLCAFSPVSTAKDTRTTDNGQVVIIYEEDKVSEEKPEEILDEALGNDYTIEDTIVVDAADESEKDITVGVISSENYNSEELLDILHDTDGIKYAEPNYIFKAFTLPAWNDSYMKDAWHLGEQGINVDKAPVPAQGSNPIVIAVMDSGIAYDHPDIESRMWQAPVSVEEGGAYGLDCVDRDDNPYDENGHGTHCAGIIAASADNGEGIAGVTGKNEVQLLSVRVLDEAGKGELADIIKGYDYLIEAKKQGANIKAVNCSFGTEEKSSLLDYVINQAGDNGILTIAAAGNESKDNDFNNTMPANSNSPYVISVAASDEEGRLASFSNYGKENVDVAAPGSNILSSVSYDNYAPYLYDTSRIRANTDVYGEFGGAEIGRDSETGKQSVKPVSGTDYEGNAITGIETFGESKMYSISRGSSSVQMNLSITNGSEHGAFPSGNNRESLRWTIKNPGYGEKFILFFPYEKHNAAPYVSVVYKTQTELDPTSGGTMYLGDIIVQEAEGGKIQYSVSSEGVNSTIDVDKTWNSIWRSSEMEDILYAPENVSGLQYGSYGLGFVYEAWDNGDVTIDISSLAISTKNPDVNTFGKYDIFSGTSEAAPVVSGAIGLIAAQNPQMNAESLKTVLLNTTKKQESLQGKCVTGATVDFAAYHIPEPPNGDEATINKENTGESKKTTVVNDEKTKFTWSGKKLTSKIKVMTRKPLSKTKMPKQFRIKKQKGKALLKWKKVKGINGYLIFRKTGKGRFLQIKKLSSRKIKYIDKTVKKGRKYQYIIVSYKKVKGSKAVRISPATKAKKFRAY